MQQDRLATIGIPPRNTAVETLVVLEHQTYTTVASILRQEFAVARRLNLPVAAILERAIQSFSHATLITKP